MSRYSLVNWLLTLGVVALAAGPLLLVGSEADFGGSDGVAIERIEQRDPGYEPWFAPLFEPASETASGLFALQAAIGAGLLGFVFGVASTRRRLARQAAPDRNARGDATPPDAAS